MKWRGGTCATIDWHAYAVMIIAPMHDDDELLEGSMWLISLCLSPVLSGDTAGLLAAADPDVVEVV